MRPREGETIVGEIEDDIIEYSGGKLWDDLHARCRTCEDRNECWPE